MRPLGSQRDPKWKGKARVCTRTLYHYIDLSLLKVTNLDLANKPLLSVQKIRAPAQHQASGEQYRQPAGRGSEAKAIRALGDRYWGRKKFGEDDVILTLERKTRNMISEGLTVRIQI